MLSHYHTVVNALNPVERTLLGQRLDKLTHVLLQSGIDMTAPQMLKRVNLMDSQAQSLQVIAEKLQMSLNDTSEYDEVKRLTDEYGKILMKFQKQVDGLGRTQ